MQDRYDRIRCLSRPQYEDLPPMPIRDRAAQFSPFAALVGYDEAVAETARLTDSRIEPDEDGILALNEALHRMLDRIAERPVIRAVYFIPDARKTGGRYAEKTGAVRIYDSYAHEIVFVDGTRIRIADLLTLMIVDVP